MVRDQSLFIPANTTTCHVIYSHAIVVKDDSLYNLSFLIFLQPIDPKASKVNMLGTKVEVKLKKNGEPYRWKKFELPTETRPDDEGDETPDSD